MNPGNSSRRLAVQLHNRRHPIPGSVVALVVGILFVGGVLIWAAAYESPSERSTRELRERIHQSQNDIQKEIDKSNAERRAFTEKLEREREAELQRIEDRARNEYREGYHK